MKKVLSKDGFSAINCKESNSSEEDDQEFIEHSLIATMERSIYMVKFSDKFSGKIQDYKFEIDFTESNEEVEGIISILEK